jgi:hypothetical protein
VDVEPGGIACRPTAVASLNGFVRVGFLIALTAAVTACGQVPEVVCPAVGWSSSLTVELSPAWPARDSLLVSVLDCSPGSCSPIPGTAEGPRWSATLGDAPETITVEIRDRSTLALVERVHVPVTWVRVGGSERCGGPQEAVVSVPPP